MAYSGDLQRRIMGRFTTGVVLVTTVHDGNYSAMTANSLTSLSLDPPLVLIAVNRLSFMRERLIQAKCFALNLLSAEQEEVARYFATRGEKDFSQLSLSTAKTGAPILADSLAYVDCSVVQSISGGDHEIFIGECVAGEEYDGQPLVFFNGRYTRLAASTFAESQPENQFLLEDTFEYYGSF